MNQYRSRFYRYLLVPRSTEPDEHRREYILNILLSTLTIAALVALSVSTVDHFSKTIAHNNDPFATTLIFTIVILVLFAVSRLGHFKTATYILVALLVWAATQQLLQWGFMLPNMLLFFAMTIVLTGTLLGARAGLWMAAGIGVLTLIVSYAQVHHYLHPDLAWTRQQFFVGDAIGSIALLVIIGLISWLGDREIDRTLTRARASETALAIERDTLEVRVAQRTRQLEETQMTRLLELSRFAEFGRLSANLLHEVANPLTAASLNLEQISDDKHSELVARAKQNLQRLERYVTAARKQIGGQSEVSLFSVFEEMEQIVEAVEEMRKKHGVVIDVEIPPSLTIRGDAVKFNQIFRNLLANAIEAYAGIERQKRDKHIRVTAKSRPDELEILVIDHGNGIARTTKSRIFEPFFSTKPNNSYNMGIGLAMVKQFIEDDFGGQIAVKSSRQTGTTMVVTLPLKKRHHNDELQG